MTIRQRFLQLVTVLMGILFLAACSSSDSVEQTPTPTPKPPVYQSYLTADGLRQDVLNIAELAARTRLMQLLGIKMATNGWTDMTCSAKEYETADMKRYYEVWQSLIDDADKYEASLQRLQQSTALGTTSTTRAWNIPFFGAFKLGNLWRKSASAGRIAIMAVVIQSGNQNNHTWLKERFDLMSPEMRQGAKNYTEFWNNLSTGKYDDASNTIFSKMYGGLSGGTSDPEFWETAHDLGITPAANIKKTLGPMFEPAMSLVLNLTPATTVIAECGEVIKNTSDMADAVKNGEGATGGLLKVSSSIAKALINHYGHIDGMESEVEQYIENAIKETGLGVIGETEDDIIKFIEENDLINKALADPSSLAEDVLHDTGDAVVTFTDNDKESPADIVIATDSNGDRMGIGLGSKDGKVSTLVPGGKDVAVTAVDKTGDKHTQTTNIPAGGKKSLTGSTDESKTAASDITCELSPSSLQFDADGDVDVVTVITNAKYMTASSNVSWATVSQNGWNIIVDVEANPLTEVRKGEITISLSMDNKTILKTVSVPITQEPYEVGDFDLSFIDKDKLMIKSLYELNILVNGRLGYGTSRAQYGIIYPEDIKVKEVSDDCYEVTGTYNNPMGYDYEAGQPEKLTIQPSKPYGLYYTVKFTIQAIAPTRLVEKNNFFVKDISIEGYRKDVETYPAVSDYYCEFSTTISNIAMNWGMYDDGDSKEVELSTDNLDGESFTASLKEKTWYYEDHGKYVKDAKGNDVWEPKYEVANDNKTKNWSDAGTFEMTLKWD